MSSPLDRFQDWSYGQWVALGTRLGGPEVARKLVDCRQVTVTFDDAGKFATVVATNPVWNVWKTLKRRPDLNGASSANDAIIKCGCLIGSSAFDLLERSAFLGPIEGEEGEIDFVCLSNADLGRPKGCHYIETCELGAEQGLELCNPYDAVIIRMGYRNQLRGERLLVAMKAMDHASGYRLILSVANDGNGKYPFLATDYGSLEKVYFFDGDCRFVFRRSRKEPLPV